MFCYLTFLLKSTIYEVGNLKTFIIYATFLYESEFLQNSNHPKYKIRQNAKADYTDTQSRFYKLCVCKKSSKKNKVIYKVPPFQLICFKINIIC